jgi:hypothetical protein
MAAILEPPSSSSRVEQATMTAAPTRWTVFLRTFLPWQLVRFGVINLKMFRLIWRSH